MGRSSDPFGAFLKIAVRGVARAARESERSRKRAVRMQLANDRQGVASLRRAAAEFEKERKASEKEVKLSYLSQRAESTQELNDEIDEKIAGLESLLIDTLSVDDRIRFTDLKINSVLPEFTIPPELRPGLPLVATVVPPLGTFEAWIPGAKAKHQHAINDAMHDDLAQKEAFDRAEDGKISQVIHLRQTHDKLVSVHVETQQRQNAEIDDFEAAYMACDPDAVVAYNQMVLERSEYPEEFPQEARVGYGSDSKELIVEYELPGISIVPAVHEYRYVKTKDVIEAKDRKHTEIKQRYQDVIASLALRTLHEVLEADQSNAISVVTFNGLLHTVDPSTGLDATVMLISVRTSKEEFIGLNLARIDKIVCLKNLGAKVSARPDELQAVKPIVEFNMVDKRFVEQQDALGGLESRPNLMELSPTEFEHLVSNLFSRMGLDTKLTRATRDGGVDAVAFDTRPVLGGKVVIQAKRYSNTVGVAAVRDLYGTMINEGASKGILVATSGYGPDAFGFAKDKPIELIDGGGLLYLLREQGIGARIVMLA
jgi:restriction system protein